MDRAEHVHFQRLPAEAQHEALWRLALSGLTIEEVASRTGWSPERIRKAINPEPTKAEAPWKAARRMQAELPTRGGAGGSHVPAGTSAFFGSSPGRAM